MKYFIRVLVKDNSWIHTGVGLIGNLAFFVGSILFLPAFDPWKTIGVWLFIGGSLFMLIGALGDFLVELEKKRQDDPQGSR